MKTDYHIERITKKEAEHLILNYHYLKDYQKGFKSGYIYGLFREDPECFLRASNSCLGVIIFSGLPVPELAVGMFGLKRDEQQGLYELSRLCIHPDVQTQEYNITSWFVSKAIKMFRKECSPRAILSYADSAFHNGTIYAACNFKYYGTNAKNGNAGVDWWYQDHEGVWHKQSRGECIQPGEWRKRSIKHRFLMVFDKQLKKQIKWTEIKWNAKPSESVLMMSSN